VDLSSNLTSMRFLLLHPLPRDILSIFEKECGYYLHEKTEGQFSFKRSMHDTRYPRFHLYVKMGADGTELDLHLDQQHPHKIGNHEKEWAYRGPHVAQELARVGAIVDKLRNSPTPPAQKPKKSLLKILLS